MIMIFDQLQFFIAALLMEWTHEIACEERHFNDAHQEKFDYLEVHQQIYNLLKGSSLFSFGGIFQAQ